MRWVSGPTKGNVVIVVTWVQLDLVCCGCCLCFESCCSLLHGHYIIQTEGFTPNLQGRVLEIFINKHCY